MNNPFVLASIVFFWFSSVHVSSFHRRTYCVTNLLQGLSRKFAHPVTFRSFPEIPDWLVSSCEENGFKELTAVQQIALPPILRRKDVVLQAHTGSGKTLSFGVPMLSTIDPSHSAIQAVVVVPTRELGLQVASVLKQLASLSPRKFLIMSVVDGSKNKRQTLWAAAEPPHIVVGNPSALQRLVDQGSLKLSSVDMVVVDEVDACFGNPTSKQELHKLLSRHLSNSFQDIDSIEQEEQLRSFKPDRVFRDSSAAQSISHEPYRRSRQIIFCSATIPQRKYFAQLCHRNGWSETVPALINVSEDLPMPATIEHEIILCGIDQRIQLTAHLLKEHARSLSSSEQPQQPQQPQQQEPPKCIVFVDKEEKMPGYAEFLRHSLRKAAAPAPSFPSSTLFPGNEDDDHIFAILSNDMNIEARRKALEAFKYSNASVLLSGGLATRGLDIPATSLVIQMSLPSTADEYLHRSGRTGRLHRSGKVITLMQKEEEFVLRRFMNALHFDVKRRTMLPKGSG